MYTFSRFTTAVSQASRFISILLLAVPLAGCLGYQIGPQSLFRPDVRTVHVPIARNDTFRHDLGTRLTEAVIREIESRTPYKVTHDPLADTTISLRFLHEAKQVLTETRGDDPRALDAVITVQASWVDRNGQVLMENNLLPNNQMAFTFTQGGRLVPEAGQSIESELQDAIEDLAMRIVSRMEMRW